jgi:putative NIF3 family GTP cyclohydrolase 1 type 2
METGKGSMTVPAFAVTALLGGLQVAAAKAPPPPSGLTARQIIERIQDHTGGHDREPWQGPTVDTIKAGDPDTPITGIATTFTATMDVLERAAARKANLVIAHEPTFYNHLDETAWLGDDPVLERKLAYVKEHHLVIWRFHDHLHRAPGQPDRILKGMVAALGWSAFQNAEEPYRFRLPETTLSDLAGQIKRRLGISTLRVVGDPRLQVSQVAFLPGAAGRERQVKALQSAAVQVLVVGESAEWEAVLHAVDAVGQRRPKGLILMGHVVSEELGMKECADWLRSFVPEVPIEFIPAGEPFWVPE